MSRIQTVSDIRRYFIDELNDKCFEIDKTGQKVVEMLGASFMADEPAIFGEPSQEYIDKEIAWYESQSLNINDIYGEEREPPAAWKYAANKHGEINSNYGHLVFSEKYHSQFQQVAWELSENTSSRRATMVYNRPDVWVDYQEQGKNDFICTNAVSYYIRNNELQCVVQMRSNDVVFGYKNDYAWQRYLMQKVCDLVNQLNRCEEHFGEILQPGFLFWQVQNLHVYERHFHLVK